MQYLIAYAFSLVGTMYKWGGATPMGFDCSGLIQELLASVGMDPIGDQTAQGLYEAFKQCEIRPGPGALVFYGKSTKEITHIAMMIDNERIIEAGGGGSKTITHADAERDEAYVKVRMFNRRKDVVAIHMPRYPDWVMNA